MSTRATILIKSEKENKRVSIYHHCDGYPEGVGEFLKNILSSLGRDWYVYNIANKLLKNQRDKYYELTCGQHGDEEYAYLIDVDKRELKCYSVGWDEFEWKESKVVFVKSYQKQ